MLSPENPPLIVILGPTAVGKTSTALELAEKVGGEIISADAALFYRGMDIGTAKPTLIEQKQIRHHLIDVTTPDQPWSLGTYKEAVNKITADIYGRGKLPIIVGGTGQYIRAVVENWVIPEQKPDPQLRQVLEKIAQDHGAEVLYHWLETLDSQAAVNIDYRNIRRTTRALEVIFNTGHLFSQQRQRLQPRDRVLQIGLIRPRPELYARVDSRIDWMFSNGFLQEVQALLERYGPDAHPFSAIGYREAISVLKDEISLDEARLQMQRRTRQFIRRQSNWFKADDPAIKWFHMVPGVTTEIIRLIQNFLVSTKEENIPPD